MIISNLSETLGKPPCHGKTKHGIFVKFKNQQNCCRPHCLFHHLGYSAPGTSLYHLVPKRNTFRPCGPGLSNPTSFLRPALPMAPTKDDNARDERSILRLNPATFLRDFYALYDNKWCYYMKKVSKLYCSYNPFNPSDSIWSHWILDEIKIKNLD